MRGLDARRRALNTSCGEAARGARPRRLAALFAALLCLLAPAAPAPKLRAQSGRNRAANPPVAGRDVTRRAGPAEGPVAGPDDRAKPAVVIPRSTGRPDPPRPQSRPDDGAKVGPEGDDEVVRVSTSLVPLPAAVTDAEGRPVTDLKLEDFELLVDGEPRTLSDLSRAESPANIVLLFDNSSSLNPTRAFQKEAAVRFLRSVLRPGDRAALYSISTAPELTRRLTGDTQALVHAVENLPKPEGATALFDAVAEAADYVGGEPGRKVFVVISDGTDTTSELDFDAALSAVLRHHVQLYAVRIGHSDNTNLRDLAGERRFQEFAAQTGGDVFVPRAREDFREAFNSIAADLAQQYVLSYYAPAGERADRFRAFTLRVRNRPGLRVRTRKGYYPPKG